MGDEKKRRRSWTFGLPSASFAVPWLKGLRFPGLLSFRLPLPTNIYFGGGKLILGSMSFVAIGFLAAMFTLVNTGDADGIFPAPGLYIAPSMVAVKQSQPVGQTRQINLPAGIRVNEILFENISLGKSGLAASVILRGTSTGYILVDELIIRNSEFPTLDFANGEFFTFNATSTVLAAGHTISDTASTSLSDFTFGSKRGAANYIIRDKVVDRLIVLVSSTGTDVIIDKITFDGVRAHTGGFDLDWVKAGTITLENVRVGDDGNIDSPDFIIHSTILTTNSNDGIVDSPINIR